MPRIRRSRSLPAMNPKLCSNLSGLSLVIPEQQSKPSCNAVRQLSWRTSWSYGLSCTTATASTKSPFPLQITWLEVSLDGGCRVMQESP